MENFLSGGILELKEARAAVSNAERLTSEMEETEKLLKANDKDVDAQKKFMNDKIESSIRNRREELEKAHDDQIAIAKKDLKSAEKNRKNARSKAVNERIAESTEFLNEENKKLNSQIKSVFKQGKVPSFCNTSLYYALFNAKTVKDFVIFAIAVLVAIAVIPNVVCLLLDVKTIYKVLIYIGIILIFLAIYFLVLIGTKSDSKAQAIDKAGAMRRKIAANKKQIKAMSNSIRSDVDESSYGLETFDSEISRCTQAIEEKEEAKKAALEDFDNYTAASIRTEIENENLPVIEQLELDGKALKADLEQKQAATQNAGNEIASKYAAFLGAKNANVDKIDELIGIINDGRAQTIMQALDVLNGEIK